ncbi:Cysteine proteinases superfamily protein [Raphanus sativus]|uniref:Uncharacterized protein LOC108845596 n=1 Tax=Raphanus sativus TaxID=3726 RepID=A0A6J0MQ66_RAPSA|nr:uncharacterized protein LOC108845596 [Raphanus sativus]KAJ4871746.1 Cysteine proteinases superfamily protein [Raphanus sativus]
MESDKGGIGGIGGGGIGAGGSRKEKGLNTSKREAAAKRKARPDPPQHHDVPQPTPRVFADGSKLLFDWCQIHPTLLCHIICQITDICWALVLGRILQFVYNKDRHNVNQHKYLDIDGFAKIVKLGKKEIAHNKVAESSNMAVGSLKNAMKHIHDVGIQKKKDTIKTKSKTFTVKGSFFPVKDATPGMITRLLETKGPVGMALDVTPVLLKLKDGIYRVPEPEVGKERHVITIVAHGVTLDGEIFFDVQNTWGVNWGVAGHGRIIITGTTNDIFFLDQLLKKKK